MTPAAVVPRFLIAVGLALLAPTHLGAQLTARLTPEMEQAFDAYVKAAEAQMIGKPRLQPAAGELAVMDAGGAGMAEIKNGLVSDWTAATLVRGSTVEKVLAVLQNYGNYKNFYAPDVSDSKMLRRDGNRWHVFLQLRKKQVLTVLLNSEYLVDYKELEAGLWSVASHSTKIAELEDGRELATGTGYGFLWRANTYWLLEPRPEGVYMEVRAISLSRRVPAGLAWVIKPMITTVPRESLCNTLEATARALR